MPQWPQGGCTFPLRDPKAWTAWPWTGSMCLDPFLACFHFQPRQLSFRWVECYVCGPRYGKAFNRDSHACPTIPEPLYGDFKVTELYLKVETPIPPRGVEEGRRLTIRPRFPCPLPTTTAEGIGPKAQESHGCTSKAEASLCYAMSSRPACAMR